MGRVSMSCQATEVLAPPAALGTEEWDHRGGVLGVVRVLGDRGTFYRRLAGHS